MIIVVNLLTLVACAVSTAYMLLWALMPPERVKFNPLDVLKYQVYASDMHKITYAIRLMYNRIENKIAPNEVAKKELAPYSAKDVYKEDTTMSWAKDMELPICVGKDYEHQLHFADLAKMPHVLIAGLTGSGKSMCFQNFIYWLGKSTNKIEVHAIDPKQTGFSRFIYSENPTINVVCEEQECSDKLDELFTEMNNRNALMRELLFKDIGEYNDAMDDKLPYIVLLIDELQDLPRKQESLRLLARKGRSAGIHLVLGTQNPNGIDIDMTTLQQLGAIICFRLKTKEASKRILGEEGAEKLAGKGQMLFRSDSDFFAGQSPLCEIKDFDFYEKSKEVQAARIAAYKEKNDSPAKRGRPKKN